MNAISKSRDLRQILLAEIIDDLSFLDRKELNKAKIDRKYLNQIEKRFSKKYRISYWGAIINGLIIYLIMLYSFVLFAIQDNWFVAGLLIFGMALFPILYLQNIFSSALTNYKKHQIILKLFKYLYSDKNELP